MSSYHGWTHAPKAEGGTDPITIPTPILSGAAIDWCYSTFADAAATRDFNNLADHTTNADRDSGGGPYLDLHPTTFRPRILRAGYYIIHAHLNVEDTSPYNMPTFFRIRISSGVSGSTFGFDLNAEAPGITSQGDSESFVTGIEDPGNAPFEIGFGMNHWLHTVCFADPPTPPQVSVTFKYQGAEDVEVYGALSVWRVRDGAIYQGGVVVGELDYQLT